MRQFVSLVSLVSLGLVVSCGGPRDQAAQQEAAMPPAVSLADVAGTWTMHAMTETGDSTLVTGQWVATAGMDGWSMIFAGRDPIPVRVVAVDGDSIVTEAGPYRSALREGVNVSLRSVMRPQGQEMVGTFVARYQTTVPDSVLRGRLHFVRAQ